MSTQDGWTTSSTVTSDLLKWPYGEIKSDAKLLTRPSRHVTNQRTSNYDQTLSPVEQTIKRTMSPLVRTTRPTRHSQQSQQPLQPPEHTQKRPQPRQSLAQNLRPPQQLQPHSRPQPRRQSSTLARSPQGNLTTIRHPSGRSRPQGLSKTEMANHYDNNFEHWLGPPLPTFERCPDGVQESRHLRRQSQQISGQRVRQSRQISKHIVGRALHPSDTVPSKQAYSPPAQQIPRSSQQIPAGFPPLQRNQSNKSASSDSNSSSESYIELSPTRRREIIIRVNEFVQCVMASMLSENASNVQWKPKFQKKDISYYVDETSVKPGQTRFCCVSRTHATVDEIMKLFVVSDADSMARTKRILSDSLLETQVLYVLRRPTKERQMNSMYVQYTSFRSPGLTAAREVCIAVATDMIHQSDGSTIGYCLWETVDGPEFEKATNKFEPSIMFRSGYFFRRSRQSTTGYPNESYTKIVYMVGLEHGGFSPGLTTKMLMEKSGTTVTRLCSHFRRKQLDSRTFVMKTEWASKMSAKSCKQCERQLQVLSSRVNCHSCGHVMCRSCVSKELVELHAIGLVPMYICFSCLEKAKLPTRTMLQKTQTSLGRRRLQSDTTSIVGVTTRQALSKPQSYRQTRSVVDSKLVEEEDDEDSDTGEWAFTPSGIPVRPYRMAS